MSERTREFFEQAKSVEGAMIRHAQADMADVPQPQEQQGKGLLGALLDRLGDIPQEVGHEMKNQMAHGAAEIASVLNTGSGFVQYPHDAEKEKQNEQDQGREM